MNFIKSIFSESRLGSWASVLALIFFMVGIPGSWFAETWREWFYSAGLIAFAAGALIFFISKSWQLDRNARFANVVKTLNEAVRRLVTEQLATNHTTQEKKNTLSHTMDDLSTIYTALTGSACRACIKVIQTEINGVDPHSLTIKTLCRNSNFHGEDFTHPLDHNTAFRTLYEDPKARWFFGNDLPKMASEGEYTNTTKDWSSRYKAAIVWPIRQKPPGSDPPRALGFLCVDTLSVGAFNDETDFSIGAIVADVAADFLGAVEV